MTKYFPKPKSLGENDNKMQQRQILKMQQELIHRILLKRLI